MLIIIFMIAFLLGGIIYQKNRYYKANNYPPGPVCFPLIGSAWALGTNSLRLHTSIANLAEKWGPVLRLQIGAQPFIVITDTDIIKNTFEGIGNPALLRYSSNTLRKLGKDVSMLTTDKSTWATLRKIYSHISRSIGGALIPQIIGAEISKLFAELDRHVGKETHLNPMLVLFSRNIYLHIAVRQSWSFDKLTEEEKKYHEAAYTYRNNISRAIDFFPALGFLRRPSADIALQQANIMDDYFRKKVERRIRETPPVKDSPKDFLDLLILEHQNNPKFSLESLIVNLRVVSIAGTFTTADTLEWMILYLCEHPDIQEKCYQELQEKIKGRTPAMEDQANMLYLDNVIKEVFRLHPGAPLSLPHRSNRDCLIGGYRVDEGSVVIMNLYGVGRSEKIFKNAAEFDPCRWERNPELSTHQLHFGYGPTACLGMPVAKQEVFLAAASLIQRYKFSYGPSTQTPDFIGEYKLAFSPAKWFTKLEFR